MKILIARHYCRYTHTHMCVCVWGERIYMYFNHNITTSYPKSCTANRSLWSQINRKNTWYGFLSPLPSPSFVSKKQHLLFEFEKKKIRNMNKISQKGFPKWNKREDFFPPNQAISMMSREIWRKRVKIFFCISGKHNITSYQKKWPKLLRIKNVTFVMKLGVHWKWRKKLDRWVFWNSFQNVS